MMRLSHSCLAVLLILLLSRHLHHSAAVQFYVGDGQERCISEDASVGDLLVVEYTVRPLSSVSNVVILDPSHNQIYYRDATSVNEEDTLRFAHTAARAGEHRLCFTNRDSRQQTINVQLKVGGREGEKPPGGEMAKKETLKPMESKLQQLETNVQYILTEMKEMTQREAAMKATSDSTSSRVLWFSGISTVLLLGLKAAEVMYLRQYFKSRRMIQ